MFYKVIRGIVGFFVHLIYRIDIEGLDNVPSEGSVVMCANHSSMKDPVFLIILIKRAISFVGKAELFKNKLLGWFLGKMGVFPVDRNISDIKAVKICLKVLKSGGILGIFPEGTRTEERIEVHSGAVGLAIKTKSPILPVYVGYKQGPTFFSRAVIRIGKPINIEEPEGSKPSKEDLTRLAGSVMDQIYSMKP